MARIHGNTKRRYAHFGIPKTAAHRRAISVALKARAARVRQALTTQDQLDSRGVVLAPEASCAK